MKNSRREFLRGASAFAALTAAGACAGPKAVSTPVVARYWHPETGGEVTCELCPRMCIVSDGNSAPCKTRVNRKGTLYTNGYADPCAVHVDPIEKKPFYHVMPGSRAYSIAVAGCNFRCKNCQNYTISQANPLETDNEYLPPAEVVSRARAAGCAAVAYTYSEPTVWFEYMYDTAKLARSAGLKNILVSCGYMSQAPLLDLCQYLDAANIDLKGFSEPVYTKLNSGRLQPVLDTVATLIGRGVWVEIGTLIVPEWSDGSDDLRRMTRWVKDSFGADVPMHFLRFFPMFQLADLYPTPQSTLEKALSFAADAGLHFAYAGNVAEMDSGTYCPNCRKRVVGRNGYVVTSLSVKAGKCTYCGTKIAGIWS